MPYYIWKRHGRVVAYDYSSTPRPAPAIEISDEEAREIGIYITPPTPLSEQESALTLEDLQAENTRLQAQVSVLEAQQTFLEDCILEMADVVYA